MATYEEIYGKRVDVLSSDPTLNSSYEGQVWYNSTSGTLKSVVSFGAWSSTASLPQVNQLGAGMGTATAGLSAGGYIGPPGSVNKSFEFNGSGWTNGGNLNTARHALGGFGIQTAAVVFGGKVDPGGANPANVEEYNGTSWSEETDQPAAMQGSTGAGTLTAGLSIGGQTGPSFPSRVTTTLEYDGTNWTSGGALPAAKTFAGSAGTQTAGLAFGGNIAPDNAATTTENYDGTSWTAVPGTMNTAVMEAASTQNGTQTAALSFGGNTTPAYTAYTAKTEEYDGTTWTERTSMPTATIAPVGFGSNTTAISAGGSIPAITNNCYEYNFGINTITASAWASNPALSYSVNSDTAAAGSLTSAVSAGGYNAPAGPGTVSYIANAASWNGTAWTNITDMPERRVNANGVGGTAPAFIVYGGANQPPSPGTVASYLTTTHTWNGSAWGSGPALAEGQSDGGGAGTPSAIVLLGGVAPPGTISNNIQEYNGSSWSNNPVNMPTNMSSCAATGTQTAAVVMGGYQGASPFPSAGVTNSYEWDGSSVSAGGDLCFGLLGTAGSGPQTAAFLYGGRNTGGTKEAICMTYNGTAWATAPSLGTGRDYIGRGPNGSQTSALAVAGSCPSQSLVEEFTSETSTVTASTLTTS